jgi:5-oxoprolinase (ATP-hydrolysing)
MSDGNPQRSRHASEDLWIGVDIGGTFTDLVGIRVDGATFVEKVLSSVEDYSEAIEAGISAILRRAGGDPGCVREVVHGTTVATNAILEGKGARTGLITTQGFRDVLDIRRSRRPDMYSITWNKPPVLVERYLRQEVAERLDSRGTVVHPLDERSALAALDELRKHQVESVAVCLINSFANPAHERVLGEMIERHLPGISVSLSSDVMPEAGEYERTSTVCINAYVRPVVRHYLGNLSRRLTSIGIAAPLLTMQSNGGIMSARAAADRPIHIVESGPAAGVIGAAAMARRIGASKAIAFDMGGTTAKASLVEDGAVNLTVDLEVGAGLSAVSRLNKGGGYALSTPSVDVAEVGVGGGSIAWIDESGSIRVGPDSAGARPGPACYGLGGDKPTVTDANFLLGYLNPDHLVGGALALSRGPAKAAYARHVSQPLGISVEEAAFGVRSVANASMARAIRAISTERGRDPRDAVLIAFGGNGPVHAVDLARELGVRRVVIPPSPGVFSAFGLLETSIEHDYSRSCMRPFAAEELLSLLEILDDLKRTAQADIRDAGYHDGTVAWQAQADLRYRGQAAQLIIRFPDDTANAGCFDLMRQMFEDEHGRIFGYVSPEEKIEIVNLRLKGRIETRRPSGGIARSERAQNDAAPELRSRLAYFGPKHGMLETKVLARERLRDEPIAGPAILEQYDTTIVIPPGGYAHADADGNVIVEWSSVDRVASTDARYDSVTREIVRHALESLADEMALTIIRTCRSGHVKHSGDFSTAIADAKGQLLAQGVTSPFHLGAMPDALAAIFTSFRDNVFDGDVFVLNDPFNGGMHLPDIFVIKPIFAAGTMVAVATTIVHQVDIGGRVAGGNSTLNTEVFAEGLRLPILKLFERGEPNEAVFAIIKANVRVPEKVIGDIRAQLSACAKGAQEYLALVARYGIDNLARYQDQILDATEALARETIRGIPDGTYEFEDFLDGDSIDPHPIRLHARLTVQGDEVRVDCSKSAPQVRGAINSSLSVTKSMTYTALRCLMPAHSSTNAGYMRPIHVHAPAGSVLNSVMPAASGGRAVTGYRFMDVVFGALAKAVPERVMACGDGAPIVLSVDGYDEDRRRFVLVDLLRGSWGARRGADGLGGTTLACSTGSSIPAEIMELEHPVRLEFCGYLPDTGGAGQYRGGSAVMRDIRLLAPAATFQYRSERRKYLPWGLDGGGCGSASAIIWDPLGENRLLPEKGELQIRQGNVLRICQSGGAGYGDPLARSPDAVQRDVRDGLVSFGKARELYGVVLDRASGDLDGAETVKLRQRLRAARAVPLLQPAAISASARDVDHVVAMADSTRSAASSRLTRSAASAVRGESI